MTEIRALLRILRATGSGALDQNTDEPVATLSRLPELIAQFERTGLRVDLDSPNALTGLDGDGLDIAVDISAYRTVQEGLANALKHGTAARAHVEISGPRDAMVIVVTNPANANALERAAASDRLGLLGLVERAEAVGGRLETTYEASPFRLAVTLPMTRRSSLRAGSRT